MIKINLKNGLILLFYSIFSTLCTLGILYIINKQLNRNVVVNSDQTAILFFAIVGVSYLLNFFFQKEIIKFTYSLVYDNELKLTNRLQQLTLLQKESLGTERIHGILEDLRLLIYLSGTITNTLNAVLMIVLCVGYLFVISFSGALITTTLVAGTVLIYILVSRGLRNKLHSLRDHNDKFNKFIDDILLGFRELKISATRRHNFYQKFLAVNRQKARELDVSLSNSFASVNNLSQSGLYLIFGVILFILPLLHSAESKEVSAFIVVLLFMSGPVNRLISMQSLLTRIRVASGRVKNFFDEIDIESITKDEYTPHTMKRFSQIEFRNCVWKYKEAFMLGPINLTIERGETIFIIGGNGSGKSTFINLLTGLYPPDAGEIILDGQVIANNTAAYQDLLAAIFTENYIFSHNYDNYDLNGHAQYRALLEMMEMDGLINDDDDAAVRRKFSKGQSKRISLILALLENAPILVLDEWAADQDPYFRKFFYERLIPRFKIEGKTIVAVTHDDAYFGHADRILKFEFGKIVKEINTKDQSFKRETLWSN